MPTMWSLSEASLDDTFDGSCLLLRWRPGATTLRLTRWLSGSQGNLSFFLSLQEELSLKPLFFSCFNSPFSPSLKLGIRNFEPAVDAVSIVLLLSLRIPSYSFHCFNVCPKNICIASVSKKRPSPLTRPKVGQLLQSMDYANHAGRALASLVNYNELCSCCGLCSMLLLFLLTMSRQHCRHF